VEENKEQQVASASVVVESTPEELNKIVIALPVPDYPFPIDVKIILTPELHSALMEEPNEKRRTELMYNVVFNMMTESMKFVVQEAKKLESGLILP
jgi:hypothetical protein